MSGPESQRLRVPATVIVLCVTAVVLVLVAAFTVLAFYGRDAAPLRDLVTVFVGLVNLILSGGAIVYAGSADRKAGVAVQQTNHSLDQRMADTVQSVVRQELGTDNATDPGASS